MSEQQDKEQVKTLGLVRWVQAAFMAFGLLLFWVIDKVAMLGLAMVTEPNETAVSAGAFVLSALIVVLIYRNPQVQQVSSDVAGELSKVTWPSREETTTSTIVVIVASFIAAGIVGAFDAIWSALTDLIYKV